MQPAEIAVDINWHEGYHATPALGIGSIVGRSAGYNQQHKAVKENKKLF